MKNDTRNDLGGILVIGTFTAPFLVGALYYFVACATVVMQREGLQQAADAASLSTVVVSARGMNAIAVMNVLMMCIMSILIPIRALLPAYGEIASMPCFDKCTCAIVADAAKAETKLKQKSKKAEQRGKELFKALSDAQDALAKQVPQSAVQAAKASAQRTPAFLEGANADVYSSSLSPQGCRKGLPVEDDSWKTVCKRTKPYIQEIAVRIAGPETLDTLSGACKSGPLALGIAQSDLSNPEGGSVCKEAKDAPCSGSNGHPKKVVKDGKNGSDHMQYWVKLQGKEFDSPKSGVEVASNKKTGKQDDRELDIGFAQAEIFFDCHSSWTSGQCNKDEGAMWNTKWTARLRRVHKPTISFSGDSEVKTKLADPQHWNGVRSPLTSARRDFTTGGPANTEAAQLVTSSSEGPLQ
jgi:hypothetical protein